MRLKFILTAVLITLLVAGCHNGKKLSQKEQARKQWNHTRASVLASLAKDQYETGNFDKCRQTVGEALALDPESSPLHILAAKLAMEQGALEVAERELGLARKCDPKNGEADYLTGVIYQRWQKPQQACDYYMSAADKNPTELAYVLARSEMLVVMDRQEEALQVLQDRTSNFEHSAVLHDAIGQILVQLGRNHEAVEQFRQACVLETDDDSIREHLGLALYYDRQYREAAEEIARLVTRDGYTRRGDLYTMLGETQMQLGRYRDARASFETATEIDPALASAWLSLAKASLQLGDQRRVELSIRKAQSLEPGNGDVQLLMGYLRLRQDRLADALAAFRKASALNQADTVSLCMVGYVLEKLGRSNEAVQYYGQALKLKPNDELASKLMASIDVTQ